jgi:hypothetical protein
MKISTYNGPVTGLGRGGAGRKPSEETLALQAAIAASAVDGKPRAWEGAAKEYKKNGQRLRVVALNHKHADAPLGYSMTVGMSGENLTFLATVKTPEMLRGAAKPATPAEPAAEAPKATAATATATATPKPPAKKAAAAKK